MFDPGVLTISPLVLLLGCLLDLVVGDPEWMPHPVRWIGGVIGVLDDYRSKLPLPDRVTGALVGIGLPVLVGGFVLLVLVMSQRLHQGVYLGLAVYCLWSALSARSLFTAGQNVLAPLSEGDLPAARRAVGRIVGRHTDDMGTDEISRAGIETVAEGFLDGVVSPLFWVMVAGLPGVMVYKTVNTLDSMIGYRSETYREFGRVSARFDDLMNWVPARLTLLLVPVASFLSGGSGRGSLRVGLTDRTAHPSPNAGHPEAAFAGALGCRLGGRTQYAGYNEVKPYLNEQAHPAGPSSLRQCLRLYSFSAGLAEIICLSFLLLF